MTEKVTEQLVALYCMGLLSDSDSSLVESALEAEDQTVVNWLEEYRGFFVDEAVESNEQDELDQLVHSALSLRDRALYEIAKLYAEVKEELDSDSESPPILSVSPSMPESFDKSDEELIDVSVASGSRGTWSFQHPGVFANAASIPWEIPEGGFSFSPDRRECGLNLDQLQAKESNIDFPYGFALIVIQYLDRQIVRLLPVDDRDGKFQARYRFEKAPITVDCYPVNDSIPNIWKLITPEAIKIARENDDVNSERRLLKGVETIAKRIQN